jgi:hypothetical protein
VSGGDPERDADEHAGGEPRHPRRDEHRGRLVVGSAGDEPEEFGKADVRRALGDVHRREHGRGDDAERDEEDGAEAGLRSPARRLHPRLGEVSRRAW